MPARQNGRMTEAAPLPERPIRGVIVDLGGVMTLPLFKHRRLEPRPRALLEFFLREMAEVYHRTDGAHDMHLMEVGRISEREFFERLVRRFEAEGNPPMSAGEAQEAVFGGGLTACAAMVEAVRAIHAEGIRTALLTNISRGGEALYRDLLPIDELFDVVVDSSLVGLRKPDPAIFRLTCERLGVSVEECLFYDDLACNVDAAAALGIEAVRCHDPVEVADRLALRVLGRTVAPPPAEFV